MAKSNKATKNLAAQAESNLEAAMSQAFANFGKDRAQATTALNMMFTAEIYGAMLSTMSITPLVEFLDHMQKAIQRTDNSTIGNAELKRAFGEACKMSSILFGYGIVSNDTDEYGAKIDKYLGNPLFTKYEMQTVTVEENPDSDGGKYPVATLEFIGGHVGDKQPKFEATNDSILSNARQKYIESVMVIDQTDPESDGESVIQIVGGKPPATRRLSKNEANAKAYLETIAKIAALEGETDDHSNHMRAMYEVTAADMLAKCREHAEGDEDSEVVDTRYNVVPSGREAAIAAARAKAAEKATRKAS